MQIFLKDLKDVKLLLVCVDGGSARLKFWRRSRDPKKGVGTRRLNLAAYVASPAGDFRGDRISSLKTPAGEATVYAARDGFAAKSHSTTTQYRYF